MMGIIAKQPNGRYCRYSTIVETFTHINMTKEDYLNNYTGNISSTEEAEEILEYHTVDFTDVLRQVTDLNTDLKELRDWIVKMIDNDKIKAEIV